jgi:hypothetical protein
MMCRMTSKTINPTNTAAVFAMERSRCCRELAAGWPNLRSLAALNRR